MSVAGSVKNFAGMALGLMIFVGIIALGIAFIMGAAAFSFWVLKWTYPAFMIAVGVSLLLLVPLALIPPTRMLSAIGFLLASFVFGAILWLWTMAYTYSAWGLLGVIIGLFLGGIGVVPVALVAALFHGDWGHLGLFVVTIVLTIGTRALAHWLEQKAMIRAARLNRSEITAEAYRVQD
jgi:hypothetical protein